MNIEVKLDNSEQMPIYKHPGDAGADLKTKKSHAFPAGSHVKVPTGVRVEIPQGYVGLIQPRSGLASNGILAATGVVDSGYRGEVSVTLYNHSRNAVVLGKGDRIAQLLIIPVVTANFVEVDELSISERGEGGYGSTGK